MAVLRAERLWLQEVEPGSELPPPQSPAERTTTATVFTVPAGKKAIVRTITLVWTGSIPIAAQTGAFVHVRPAGGPFGIAVHRYWQPLNVDAIFAASLTNIWTGTLVLRAGDSVEVSNSAYLVLATHGSGMLVDA